MKAVFQIAKKPTDGRAFILLMSGPEMIGRCFWVNNPRRIAYPDGQKVVVGVLREGNKVYVCIRRAPNGRRTGLGNRDWMIRDNPSGFAQRNIVRSQATVDGLVLDLIQWTTETE